nr:hypothetical protein [Cressdnaviricota sp.]UOF81297.1 hypothetical protein [Cressdnaviricota sp.]
MVRFSTYLGMKRLGVGIRRGGYYKSSRFSRRYRTKSKFRRTFIRGEKKGFRLAKRKSGSIGKVGVYFPELGAKVYVSRKKYKVMRTYAKLIVNYVVHHHQKRRTDMEVLGENHHDMEEIVADLNKYKRVPWREYRRMVNHVLVQMIKKNWYQRWYAERNEDLAKQAEHVLMQAHADKPAGIDRLLPPEMKHFEVDDAVFGALNALV